MSNNYTTNRKSTHTIINMLMFFISILVISHVLKSAKEEGKLNKQLLQKENLYNILVNRQAKTEDSIATLVTKIDSLRKVQPQIKIKYEQIKKDIISDTDSMQYKHLESLLTTIEQYSDKKN